MSPVSVEPQPTPGLPASLQLLATRRFGTFWVAGLLSNIGTWAQQVAEPWLLLSLGATPLLLGLDAFALDAPGLLLSLWGGVLADRAERRRVILVFQSVQMLCPTAIVVLLGLGVLQPWQVVPISLVVGVTDALSMPSFQSIVPSLVEPPQLGSAFALNSTQFNLSRIPGPALAGVLMARLGAQACFEVNALSYLPFIGVALWILPRGVAHVALDRDGARRDLVDGLRSAAHMPELRGPLLTVLATSALCAPLVTFSPVLAKQVFHAEVGQFGAVMSAFGVGGLMGALSLLAVEATSPGTVAASPVNKDPEVSCPASRCP